MLSKNNQVFSAGLHLAEIEYILYNEEKDAPSSEGGDEKQITGGALISPSSLKRNVEYFPAEKLEQWRYNI